MHYKYIFFIGLLLPIINYAEQEINNEHIHISVQAQKTKKVSIGLVLLGNYDKNLEKCINRIQKDLEWSNQCNVIIKHCKKIKHETEMKKIFDEDDVAIALFLSKEDMRYSWRLYDLLSLTMVSGTSIDQGDMSISMIAHTIADDIWPQLFNQLNSFRSKIVYAKQIWRMKHGREKPYKQIWIADFDGSNAQLFIDAPTISFAPRWNNDLNCPLLFYSQNTLSNIQLVMNNMFGKRQVICSFDGLNMQPTFSDDGKKVVLCLSKDGTSQLYMSFIDMKSHQRKLDRLTFNSGNNLAPCFIDSGTIVFVSDFETNKPQVYSLDLKTKQIQRITQGGYCACPNYSSVRRQLVYSKMMDDGVMQLFLYDFKTKKHNQLTFGSGNKEEGCWSVCGNYIIFSVNEWSKSRIAQLHLQTNKIHYLTSDHEHCTYPHCSPIYNEYLGILNK